MRTKEDAKEGGCEGWRIGGEEDTKEGGCEGSKMRTKENVREEGNTYYADIAFPAWWLNQNKHVKEGLVDVKAEDICGINYYFKPSKKLFDLIETF